MCHLQVVWTIFDRPVLRKIEIRIHRRDVIDDVIVIFRHRRRAPSARENFPYIFPYKKYMGRKPRDFFFFLVREGPAYKGMSALLSKIQLRI